MTRAVNLKVVVQVLRSSNLTSRSNIVPAAKSAASTGLANAHRLAGRYVLKEDLMSWPNNADGDVFRSLESNNFDFQKEYVIDVNIDFDHWPLTNLELEFLSGLFESFEVVEPETTEEDLGNGKGVGFVQVQVKSKLSYDFIVNYQELLSGKTKSIGGFCNSWGVGQW